MKGRLDKVYVFALTVPLRLTPTHCRTHETSVDESNEQTDRLFSKLGARLDCPDVG